MYYWGAYVFIFLAFVISPIWIYEDVKSRGMSTSSALKWAFAAFPLFIIVIPLWFCVRPKLGSEGAGMCPICKEILIRDPVCCPHCGHLVKEGVVDLSGVESFDDSEEDEGII